MCGPSRFRLSEYAKPDRPSPKTRTVRAVPVPLFALVETNQPLFLGVVEGSSSHSVSVELANVTFPESGTLTSGTVSEAVVAAALPGCCSMTGGSVIFTPPVPSLTALNGRDDLFPCNGPITAAARRRQQQAAHSIFHIFYQPSRAGFRAKDVARLVRRDALGGTGGRRLFRRVGNECCHPSVGDLADSDPAFPAVVIF